MRRSLQPIDQLTKDWLAVSRGSEAVSALRLLSSREPAVAATRSHDLHELVEKLRGTIGAREGDWAPRVLQAMLRSGSIHPLIPRSILQALLPGLITVARRLSWGSGGDWSDGGTFFSDLITTAWEVINEWCGEDRPYALLDLLSAVRCRMRRQILTGAGRDRPIGPEIERRLTSKASSEQSDLEVLAHAIQELSGSQIDRTGAAVLYGSRVLGLTMAEMARMTGRSRRFLADRRRRAETQLCA